MTAQTTEEIRISLGSYYQHCVPIDKKRARRLVQYALQSIIADIIHSERLARCRRSIVPGRNKVDLLYSQKLARAHYGNLMVCGSVWICPICAARITERRREEVSKGIDTFQDLGGSVFMAAFTLQHEREERLQDLKQDLTKAYRQFNAGHYQEIKKEFGIVGSIGALEVTWSNNAGWHPHKHCLYFSEKELNQKDISELQEIYSKRYCSILKSLDRFGSDQAAVRLSLGDPQETKDYIFKWGLSEELTKAPVKSARGNGYSPFELASWAAQTGELQPVLLFREYFDAFKGSHQLQYSRGLRDLLDLGIDQSDKDLAEENTAEAVLMAQIDRETWKVICTKRVRGELLEVASSGNIDLVVEYLEKITKDNNYGIYTEQEQ